MQMSTYLSFKGQCETAFRFYEQCLGGQLGAIFKYGGSPMAGDAPADWPDKVMHASLTVGNQVLMGGDVAPDRYEAPKGFSLSIQITSTADAERIFHELARDGKVVAPLEKTFWAERFGVLVDRFGIPWLINCEVAEQLRRDEPLYCNCAPYGAGERANGHPRFERNERSPLDDRPPFCNRGVADRLRKYGIAQDSTDVVNINDRRGIVVPTARGARCARPFGAPGRNWPESRVDYAASGTLGRAPSSDRGYDDRGG